ncbi:hypothetical protein GQ466_11810 [Actinomadura rayongensis]|uniref:Uncharacterized protein n=1 Tax=Actinomadura rayongensis TaxID=1429076 RepID=A0A6I4WCE9_9ACTN|nr:hypothetical protein [Actinomadura rayongensis]
MEHELAGLRGPGGRWRPVAAGPFTLLAVVLALPPIRPVWLWAGLITVVAAVPWALGAVPDARPRRHRPYWRLSADGLERVGPGGLSLVRYERSRIEGLAITTGDDVLTVFHKFGRTAAGPLATLGMEPIALFVAARRLGIPVHVLDGDSADLLDPAADESPRFPTGDTVLTGLGPLPRDQAAEQRLLDQEARLLAAAHEPATVPDPERGARPVRLASPAPRPSRRRIVVLGVLAALIGVAMVARVAVDGADAIGDRIAAGCWALMASAAGLLARRRLLTAGRVEWTISAEGLAVRSRPAESRRRGAGRITIAASRVAAVIVGPGLRPDPLTGAPRATELSVLVFDHGLDLIARLPAHGMDAFQLAHALDEHGYTVITPGAPPPRLPHYGVDGLPDIFARVPGGRLVVADGGLGWADAAGDVVLRMPEDRIGGVELLTISGHAWVRLYDTDGDEFFAAPLSALRISRTDLREKAREAGLPVTDAEYDAYMSAAFHAAVSALSVPEPEPAPRPEPAPGVLLDATRRSRILAAALSVLLCEVVAVLGALWIGPDLGGFARTAGWSVPAGLVAALAGSWLYDRNRAQLKVSVDGVAVVTRRGRVEWDLARERVGGVGIDESGDRMPRLVVWGPSGRVLRQVTFPPDLRELRRACERYGLPWGPPDEARPVPPPPEL